MCTGCPSMYNYEELQILQLTLLIECRRKWKEYIDRIISDRIQKHNLKPTKKEKEFGKLVETIEGPCFAIYIPDLKRHNIG